MDALTRKIICKALDNLEDLTERENDFINNLADRDEENPDYTLSKKQRDWLHDIWAKIS